MKVLTVANQKGGIGKTTTFLCLGAQLEQRGFKVLYIDLDAQNDGSRTLNADTEKAGSYELLANRLTADKVIQTTPTGQDVIASNDGLANITSKLNEPQNQIGKEFILRDSLKSVKDKYDYVIIDTAKDLNPATLNALTCTDYLIISATADDYSLKGISTLLTFTDVVKQYTNKKIKTAGVLLTRYNDRSNINKFFKEEIGKLAEQYNTKVFNTVIRENATIKESQALKTPITEYAPKSNGNVDYQSFTEELLKEIEG